MLKSWLDSVRRRIGSDWRLVLRHAWSIRLLGLAIVLDIVAAVLPLFAGVSIGLTAALVAASGLISMAAFVARFVAQKEFENEK